MDRRRLLRSAAGLLAGVGLAGCTGADGEVPVTAEPPPPGVGGDEADGANGGGELLTATPEALSIENYTETESEDGTLVVLVTVSNESVRRQVRLVRVTVTLDGVETVAETFVALGPGATETVRLGFDVGYQAWLGGGSYVPEIVDRTPATPLPTDTPTPEPTTGTSTSGEGADTPTPSGAADTSTPTGTADAGGDSPTGTPEADTRSETATGTPSDDGADSA